MDTNNSYQSNNDLSSRTVVGGDFGYDIENEKQRISLGIEEIKKEIAEKFRKKYANAQVFPDQIAAMHPEVVDFLLSFNLVSVYDNIARQANLDGKGRNILPQVVWQAAQTKNWNGVEQELQKQIALAQNTKALVLQLLEQNIIGKIRVISEKPFARKENFAVENKKKTVSILINDALVKYPKVGEQQITNNPLKLRYFPNPVRPSVKNWITDFHDNMGGGKHSSIDRGNYLFHGENGKKLTPIERQKLSVFLKALDENLPIAIDAETQSIVFEMRNTEREEMGSRGMNENEGGRKWVDDNVVGGTRKTELSSDAGAELRAPARTSSVQNQNDRINGDVFERFSSEPTFQNSVQQSAPQSRPQSQRQNSIADFAPKAAIDRDNYFGNAENNQPPAGNQPVSRMTSPNFAASSGIVHFSSPQKFAAEQQQPKVQAIVPKSDAWTIKPREDVNANPVQQKNEPKLDKNIVDLRNL